MNNSARAIDTAFKILKALELDKEYKKFKLRLGNNYVHLNILDFTEDKYLKAVKALLPTDCYLDWRITANGFDVTILFKSFSKDTSETDNQLSLFEDEPIQYSLNL